jgi:imidazole glycerol-phosphate synthase subunit HisF
MLKHRVIPCLLLRNGGLVKTLKFSDAKYVGDPINAIRIFNDKEVDELMVLDITASKEKKEPNYALIEQFASECFMPLSYGGGIKNMEQAQRLFNSGIEKICLQTSVLDDLSLVKNLSDKWGSSSILVSIDVKRNWMGQPKLYAAATGKTSDKKWTDFMQEAVKAGAGEIVLNAVDKDGTMKGMDIELIKEAAKILSVPLVAVGGVGSLVDIKAAVDAGANAVSAGAFFVFQGPHRAVLITYPKYNELVQLLS